jgi:hypothetical protein
MVSEERVRTSVGIWVREMRLFPESLPYPLREISSTRLW